MAEQEVKHHSKVFLAFYFGVAAGRVGKLLFSDPAGSKHVNSSSSICRDRWRWTRAWGGGEQRRWWLWCFRPSRKTTYMVIMEIGNSLWKFKTVKSIITTKCIDSSALHTPKHNVQSVLFIITASNHNYCSSYTYQIIHLCRLTEDIVAFFLRTCGQSSAFEHLLATPSPHPPKDSWSHWEEGWRRRTQ